MDLAGEDQSRFAIDLAAALDPAYLQLACSSWTLAPSAKVWIDLGSGGGFPGMVSRLRVSRTCRARWFIWSSATRKKAAFLREALRVTGASGTIHLADIEDIVDKLAGPVDCVTARARGSATSTHRLCGTCW